MRQFLYCCVLLLAFKVCVAGNDNLIVDRYFSPYAGTALNLSVYNAYMTLDDLFLPTTYGKTSLGYFIGRTAKLLVDDVLSEFLMVVQHEVFGHGYRAREYHFSSIGYELGIGWGWTGFTEEDFEALSSPKKAALFAAGMEANAILSAQLRQNWILQNTVDRREAIFYLITTLDQANYIRISSDDNANQGNDINGYVDSVNSWYGDTSLTVGNLHAYSLWDFLDPSLYMSLYSMVQYLHDGTPHTDMFMFDLEKFKYNFCGRLLLTPYGPEFQLQNYVLTDTSQLWQVNIRYGNNSGIQSYGLDIWLRPIFQYQNWTFSNKAFVWYQPKYLQANTAINIGKSIGVAEFLTIEYKMPKQFYGFGEFGYKTAGYIQGIPLGNSWIWRLGFGIRY